MFWHHSGIVKGYMDFNLYSAVTKGRGLPLCTVACLVCGPLEMMCLLEYEAHHDVVCLEPLTSVALAVQDKVLPKSYQVLHILQVLP